MSVMIDRATLACEVCGAHVTELRRGRCWGCYTLWAESRPVGKGATCAVCNERRRERLKLVELHRRTVPLCHACAAQTMRLPEIPRALDELKQVLNRERRSADRRQGEQDRRIFPRERRVGERREVRASGFRDTDPNMHLPDFGEVEIEIRDEDMEVVDQTMVKKTAR